MDTKKLDPTHAHLLDAPQRDEYLSTTTLVELLELTGSETVVDYGAGTGRVARAAAQRREVGPPDELLYTAAEAAAELEAAGLKGGALDAGFPFHFTLRAVPA